MAVPFGFQLPAVAVSVRPTCGADTVVPSSEAQLTLGAPVEIGRLRGVVEADPDAWPVTEVSALTRTE